ncbi:MAG: hypothetical protein ACTSRG_17320 [Candidatus Helarchaeota archaeon]
MITSSENWKDVVKPFLKEKKFSYIDSKKAGKSIVLKYKKEDLFVFIEFFQGEISIEITEGKNKQLYLEELQLLLG